VACEGINLLLTDGEVAGQEVPRIHLHVIPRFTGDSFRVSADWSAQPDRDVLDGIAAKIRRQL
jgi:diadenosine tetraphosphate (Ap4A) HIT family hydrolase